MKKSLLLALLAASNASLAVAQEAKGPDAANAGAADLSTRIQSAQNMLLLHGSNAEVLSEYDDLVLAIAKSLQKPSKHTLAQVYYQRSLIEISMGKTALAIADLVEALDIDASFQPASRKLAETWLDRGQFSEIRARFAQSLNPELYTSMAEWESAFDDVVNTLNLTTILDPLVLDHCLDLVDNTLLRITKSNPAVYELRVKIHKTRAVLAFKAGEHPNFDEILRDYAKLIKLLPQRSLDQYLEYSQYLLFTRGSFDDAWNAVKSGIRIDNDHKPCGWLSKVYNRLQNVLKPLEEYFILHEYLYPSTESTGDLSDEKLRGFHIDFKHLFDVFTGPITLSKRDMKDLPSSVNSVYDFLVYQADAFARQEFGQAKMGTQMPLIEVLNKFMCEASVRAKKGKTKFCGLVDDKKLPFLPKQVARIDALLRKKDYNGAKQLLSKYNKNVQKTSLFQKRWKPVHDYEEMQQHRWRQQQEQQRQEQFYRQQQEQQRQQQQQQQEQKFDRSKDYYKVLDVSRDADEKTIKKAYRTQTLKYHPDKYKGTDLTEKQIELKMQDINEAYEVLSDPETRADYDHGPRQQQQHHQHHPHHGGFQQAQAQGHHPFGFDPSQFMNGFGHGGFNVHF